MRQNIYKKNLTFSTIKKMAKSSDLSKYEKIGFPDSYRKEKEKLIFNDILLKLSLLKNSKNISVLDIGPGCSDLPNYLIDFCEKNKNELFLCDSLDMMDKLPNRNFITKIDGPFPKVFNDIKKLNPNGFDIIICYSVFHYIAFEFNVFDFIDKSILLLKDGGEMIIGDIPNFSKRRRFFSSDNGKKFHKNFTKTDKEYLVEYNKVLESEIDESIIDSVINRARFNGCDAYLMPQNKDLPMSNRRDDLIIMKP